MKHELDRMMSIIKDYKTGYGGVTDSFMRKELEIFVKDYHTEQCNITNVGQQSELYCECEGNRHVEYLGYQLKCSECGKDVFR